MFIGVFRFWSMLFVISFGQLFGHFVTLSRRESFTLPREGYTYCSNKSGIFII